MENIISHNLSDDSDCSSNDGLGVLVNNYSHQTYIPHVSPEDDASSLHDEASVYHSSSLSPRSPPSSGYSSQTSTSNCQALQYSPTSYASSYASIPDSPIADQYKKHQKSASKRKGEFPDGLLSESIPDKKKKKKHEHKKKPGSASTINPTAQKIMEKLGYIKGEGLGLHKQGIVDPIEPTKVMGRRGFGHIIKGLEEYEDEPFDPSMEEISVEETPVWLMNINQGLTQEDLEHWCKEDERVMEMDSYLDFCDPEVLYGILKSKMVFDDIEDKELHTAVMKSNPFEKIASGGVYLNRAAMKMANMDKVFDYMFTNPVDANNKPVVDKNQLLYFADVCAGPGGFSEYVLSKKHWRAKGIGFTLRDEKCDFKLEDFIAGTPETFEPYYGVKGDGDVYCSENIRSLTDFVMAKTNNEGVHFVMADGGFSVDGRENIQEIVSKQLYLCQFLVSLCITRVGGHFVCKLFDLFTPFSVGLVYLMYKCFDKICIHKPNTSRPANSERYIICYSKRDDCEAVRNYMFELNEHLNRLGSNSPTDISECVPKSELMGDNNFFNYIYESNCRLGRRQLVNLKKVIHYAKNSDLPDDERQQELRRNCLEYWGVPVSVRKAPDVMPDRIAAKIIDNFDFALEGGEKLTSPDKLHRQFRSLLDWTCMPFGNSDERHFYIGCRNRVYVLKNDTRGWRKLDVTLKLELSPGTLVYGEIIEEVSNSIRPLRQRRVKSFHIIDAITLGNDDIRQQNYSSRLSLCQLYAKALHKDWQAHINPNTNSCLPYHPMNIRVFPYNEFKHLRHIVTRLEKDIYRVSDMLITLEDNLPQRMNSDKMSPRTYSFAVKGIMFYNLHKSPWSVHFSKTNQRCYYFNSQTNEKLFVNDFKGDIYSDTMECFKNRREWIWVKGVGIKDEDPVDGVLHKKDFFRFIDELKSR